MSYYRGNKYIYDKVLHKYKYLVKMSTKGPTLNMIFNATNSICLAQY